MVTNKIVMFLDDIMVDVENTIKRISKLLRSNELLHLRSVSLAISRFHSVLAKIKTSVSVKNIAQNKIRNHTWKKKKSIEPLATELSMLLVVVICF